MPSYLTTDMYYALIKHLDLHIVEPTYDKCKEIYLELVNKPSYVSYLDSTNMRYFIKDRLFLANPAKFLPDYSID